MAAYFRMSDAIFDCPCALELAQATHGDHCSSIRVLLFVKLLTYSLSTSKEFIDASSLAAISGTPIKQAQKVWDTCVKHGVLRRSEYGYSARAWMIEHGFLGKYQKQSEIDKAFREGIYGKEG